MINGISREGEAMAVQNTGGETAIPLFPPEPPQGLFPQQSPHKIFLWNDAGVYVDCAFPNPVYGHFMGGTQVAGARLKDLFSRVISQQIFKALTKAFTHQEGQSVVIDLKRQKVAYQANIQLIPIGQHVMGLVTDSLVGRQPIPSVGESCSQLSLEKASLFMMLTNQEKNIVQAFGPGHSNRQISEILGLSERMVQFHMYNLLHKLQLPSRAHLAHLGLFDADTFPS